MTSRMEKTFKTITLFCFVVAGLQAFSLDIPAKPSRLVNDYANVLSNTEEHQLEQKLVAYNDSTSTQIAVVTIPSLEGEDLFDYSQRLAEAWGIGGGKNDNGVLLLVALKEHEIRIHTGYGVEGALPDAISKRIIENDIKPAFREDHFYEGLDHATNSMIAALAGEYHADPRNDKPGPSKLPIIFIVVLLIFIFSVARRRRSTSYSSSGRRHYGTPWIGGLGGGGRSSWGGGGGGGFGGFGGGSFGGGGASGRW